MRHTQPRTKDRRCARSACHCHHRHRISGGPDDRRAAAPEITYVQLYPVKPDGCRDYRRPEEGHDGEDRRGERAAAAISEARERARDVNSDARFMTEAVALGQGARGRTAPNPNVGCVIVSSSGKIVGKGATAAGGRPHAEAVALDQAGKRARGATVYVTLEPCAHASRAAPPAPISSLPPACARRDRVEGSRSAHSGRGIKHSARLAST